MSGCWLWGGYTGEKGYGQIMIGGITYRAHRVSYEQHIGPIPEGMLVCHTCDTPSCINPEHLFVGTAKDNTQDAIRKKRAVIGEANARAKLTEAQVLDILRDDRTPTQISKDYDV